MKNIHLLSFESKAELGLLPEWLSVKDIANLWEPDHEDIRDMRKADILDAVWAGTFAPMKTDRGNEVLFQKRADGKTLWTLHPPGGMQVWTDERNDWKAVSWLIHRDRFKAWLKDTGQLKDMAKDCLLLKWIPDDKKDICERFYSLLKKQVSVGKDHPDHIAIVAAKIWKSDHLFSEIPEEIVSKPSTYDTSNGNSKKQILGRLRKKKTVAL